MKEYTAFISKINNFVSILIKINKILGDDYLLTTLERLNELNIDTSNLENKNILRLNKEQLQLLIKETT